MKAIIFGANGQDGYFLAGLLGKKQIDVVSVSRSGNGITGDVGNYGFVSKLIGQIRPQFIFHLAANSTTKHDAIFENHESISTGTLNILESARLFVPDSKIFLSGSAMQFKNDGFPINENTTFHASSPYSVSRIQSVYIGRYFREKFGLKVYIGYFFNHDSPLRTERHINQRIVKVIKRIAQGSSELIEIGDVDVRKEFNFAGDSVEAVWILVSQDRVFELVIGCGEAHSIREWLNYCSGRCRINWEDHFMIKKSYIPEYRILVSDPTLLISLGWSPKTTFNQLADMMMENKI